MDDLDALRSRLMYGQNLLTRARRPYEALTPDFLESMVDYNRMRDSSPIAPTAFEDQELINLLRQMQSNTSGLPPSLMNLPPISGERPRDQTLPLFIVERMMKERNR